jgi:hypothetical protein
MMLIENPANVVEADFDNYESEDYTMPEDFYQPLNDWAEDAGNLYGVEDSYVDSYFESIYE